MKIKDEISFVASAILPIMAAVIGISQSVEAVMPPSVWRSISTNDIIRWQTANGAKNGVVVNRDARTVTFLAEASGVAASDPVEFLLIGPDSDRAYESFAVAAASPSAIAAGLEAVGVPRGEPVDAQHSRFWPKGERISIKARWLGGKGKDAFGLAGMLTDGRAAEEGAILDRPIIYSGGARDASNALVAETNMPCAIFALYNHSPSLLQFDGMFDQSGVYGRFLMKRPYKAGELFEFTLAYDGSRQVESKVVKVGKGADLSEILGGLRTLAQKSSLYASLAFAPDVLLADAMRAAQAFALVDGSGVRMNGAAPGQFFFRAYLPEAKWRQREGRIFQPFEVHVAADGAKTFVYIEEDYSGEGLDPVLKPRETRFSAWGDLPGLIKKAKADKVNVLFMYAPSNTPVGELTPIIEAVSPRIATFYLFEE